MEQKIIYRDKDFFLKTLESIKKEWKDKLHILADFDRTLTKCFINWKSRPSLIWAMRQWDYLWEEYSKKASALFEYYHPIEINPSIDTTTKIEEMSIWWNKHLSLLVKSWLNKKNISEIINSWIIELRNWNDIFFKFLEENQIPLIIISANWLWGDSIKLYLEKQDKFTKNINIISNEFIWDAKDYAKWYKNTVIHTFNKSETVLRENKQVYKKIENRKNVILLWDSLWDPSMIDWFEYDNLIKIGFLNHKEEELLPEYKKMYDIIITWDWSFDIINEILESIK